MKKELITILSGLTFTWNVANATLNPFQGISPVRQANKGVTIQLKNKDDVGAGLLQTIEALYGALPENSDSVSKFLKGTDIEKFFLEIPKGYMSSEEFYNNLQVTAVMDKNNEGLMKLELKDKKTNRLINKLTYDLVPEQTTNPNNTKQEITAPKLKQEETKKITLDEMISQGRALDIQSQNLFNSINNEIKRESYNNYEFAGIRKTDRRMLVEIVLSKPHENIDYNSLLLVNAAKGLGIDKDDELLKSFATMYLKQNYNEALKNNKIDLLSIPEDIEIERKNKELEKIVLKGITAEKLAGEKIYSTRDNRILADTDHEVFVGTILFDYKNLELKKSTLMADDELTAKINDYFISTVKNDMYNKQVKPFLEQLSKAKEQYEAAKVTGVLTKEVLESIKVPKFEGTEAHKALNYAKPSLIPEISTIRNELLTSIETTILKEPQIAAVKTPKSDSTETFATADTLSVAETDSALVQPDSTYMAEEIKEKPRKERRGLFGLFKKKTPEVQEELIAAKSDSTETFATADTLSVAETDSALVQPDSTYMAEEIKEKPKTSFKDKLSNEPVKGLTVKGKHSKGSEEQKGIGAFSALRANIEDYTSGIAVKYEDNLEGYENLIYKLGLSMMSGKQSTSSAKYGFEEWNKTKMDFELGIKALLIKPDKDYGMLFGVELNSEMLKLSEGTYAGKPINFNEFKTYISGRLGIGNLATNLQLVGAAQGYNSLFIPESYTSTKSFGIEANAKTDELGAKLGVDRLKIDPSPTRNVKAEGEGWKLKAEFEKTMSPAVLNAGAEFSTVSFDQKYLNNGVETPMNTNESKTVTLYFGVRF